MLFAKKVTNQLEQEEIYRQRYKIFVERDKDAPKELYPNGLLKDAIDNDAIHIGCYEEEDGRLLGFLTIVLKKDLDTILPIEEQHCLNLDLNVAEVMRLVICENLDISIRGKVLGLLLKKVDEIAKENRLNFLYLVTTKSAEKIYTRLGFKKIGPYKLYKNISNECPMRVDLKEINRIF